jgi:hypothetical protein
MNSPKGTRTSRQDIISEIQQLRYLVGLLGSAGSSGWWSCSFLQDTGLRFLGNVFPRTAREAALSSTIEAAQRVHDEALGKLGCYHLFRLPVELEDRLASSRLEESIFVDSPDRAMEVLRGMSYNSVRAPEGPVQIGVEKRILTGDSVHELAAHYRAAFDDGIRCFPYFSAQK